METGRTFSSVGKDDTGGGGTTHETIDFDFDFIIEQALITTPFIAETETTTRRERVARDSTIATRYKKRPDDTEDSLVSLRQYNYLDPTRALIMKLPRGLGSDSKTTADVVARMRAYGLVQSTIASICEQHASVLEDGRYLYELNCEALKPDERTDAKLDELRETFLEFPWNPYVRFTLRAEDEPPVRVSVDSKTDGCVYYALTTSVPLHLGDKDLIRAYLNNCVLYMLQKLESQCGLREIDTSTCVYYDYMEGAAATLYIFLQLQCYDDDDDDDCPV